MDLPGGVDRDQQKNECELEFTLWNLTDENRSNWVRHDDSEHTPDESRGSLTQHEAPHVPICVEVEACSDMCLRGDEQEQHGRHRSFLCPWKPIPRERNPEIGQQGDSEK